MLNPLELKRGQIVGYVDIEKPRPVAIEGQRLLWLVAVTEFRRERDTQKRILEELGLKSYLPVEHRQIPAGRRRKRDVELPLFTSRLFVEMPLTDEAWHRVLTTRGVRDFMRSGDNPNKPAIIHPVAIEEVRKVEAKTDAKYRRRLATAEESPYRKDRRVWAEILPLQKMLGKILETDAKGRIEILLEVEIFGRKVWPVEPHLLQFVDA